MPNSKDYNMPTSPPHPCTTPGCPELVSGGSACDKHRKQRRKVSEARRGSRHKRGYGARWDKERKAFLRLNPFCVMCGYDDKVIFAKVVDHRKPKKGDDPAFWDKTNWQPLCATHHNQKTAKEDGGFGNRKKRKR